MRKVILLVTLTALVACGSDEPPGSTGPATVGAGNFALARINGRNLPADVSSRMVFGGSLQLLPTGEYTREQRDSSRNNTGGWDRVTSQDHGTWSSRGDSIFLTTLFSAYGYGPGKGVFTATGAKVETKNPFASGTLELEFQRQP